jgi:hypothetical protein
MSRKPDRAFAAASGSSPLVILLEPLFCHAVPVGGAVARGL